MFISFFEEFPTRENLSKLKLVTWPTKLYIAAKSLDEFNTVKSKIKNKQVKEFIYWPILEINEGYWISPFSKRNALLRIFDELKNRKISVMLDLELPTTKNPLLYLTQLFNFLRNKSLIKKFIKNHPGKVYTAEYYPEGKVKEAVLSSFGLHFNPKKCNNNAIKMIYHSMHNFNEQFITKELQLGREECGDNFLVAYGTIAAGIEQDEPNLSYVQLEKDLNIAKKAGIKEIVVYRLGGLDGKYSSILKKFS